MIAASCSLFVTDCIVSNDVLKRMKILGGIELSASTEFV